MMTPVTVRAVLDEAVASGLVPAIRAAPGRWERQRAPCWMNGQAIRRR